VLTINGLHRPGIEPVDLNVGKGECVAISGPSGAGKSLLLRAIADLDPNQGEIRLNGTARENIPAPDWRRQVVYVAPESGWWAGDVGAHFADRSAAAGLLSELAMPPDALGWPVARLSTGERQRLALVRALELAPPALLLDEPTSGLDPEAASKVEDLLRRRLAHGAALVLVTHDPEQAKRVAARRLRMEHGRLHTDPEWVSTGGKT
jgi:ABC-type iron transport system FetAB ATPase subunit